MRKWLAIFHHAACGEPGCESAERVYGVYAEDIRQAGDLAWEQHNPQFLDAHADGSLPFDLIDLGPSRKRIARVVPWMEFVPWSETRFVEEPEWMREAV